MVESAVTVEASESSVSIVTPRPGYSLLWLLLFVALYFTGSILYFGGYAFSVIVQNMDKVGNPDFQQMMEESMTQYAKSASGISGMYLVQFILMIPFILWASHFKTQSWKETLGFRKVTLKSLGLWLLILAGFLVVQLTVGALFNVKSGDFLQELNGSKHILLIFVFLILAPLLEEMVLRGYLFKSWRQTRLGLTGTLLVTSVLFTLMHWGQYGLIQYVFLFALSILLGLARERTDSLWVPIVLHSANNFLPALAVVYLGLA